MLRRTRLAFVLFILAALWAILRDEPEAEQMIVDPDPSTGDAARSCAG